MSIVSCHFLVYIEVAHLLAVCSICVELGHRKRNSARLCCLFRFLAFPKPFFKFFQRPQLCVPIVRGFSLEAFERSGTESHEAVRQLEQNNSNLASVGLPIAADLAGLARNLCEMSGEPEQLVKPKAVHERKRSIGQKQDDYGHEQGISMGV